MTDILKEAIQAAAKAMSVARGYSSDWWDRSPLNQSGFLFEAEAALKAAAPYMQRQRDIVGLSATDAACYKWPAQNQSALRAAYVDGAQDYAGTYNDGKEAAANWCARQASALYKLDREPEKRAAFVEAANAIRKIGTDQ